MFSYFKYNKGFRFFPINSNIKRRTLFSEKESKKNIKIRDYTKVVKKFKDFTSEKGFKTLKDSIAFQILKYIKDK